MTEVVTVTISGMGGVINYEYYTILNALRAAGLTVVENNRHPEADPDGFIDRAKDVRRTSKVELTADHEPWGG